MIKHTPERNFEKLAYGFIQIQPGCAPSTRQQACSTLLQTIRTAHLVIATDLRPHFVDRATHGVPIQSCTPAVVQPPHHLPAPIAPVGQVLGHIRIVDQDHLLSAGQCLAGGAGNGFDGMIRQRCWVQWWIQENARWCSGMRLLRNFTLHH